MQIVETELRWDIVTPEILMNLVITDIRYAAYQMRYWNSIIEYQRIYIIIYN